MIKTTLTAVALCTLAMASAASAASIGCSGPNLTKAETMVEQMPYSPERWTAYQEIASAQEDLLAGKMRGCAVHVGHVLKMGTMKPASM